MRIQESLQRFRDLCATAGLNPDNLAPWPAWKAFKAFMREPVDAPIDGASFQCGPAGGNGPEVTAFAAFVRVFSDVDAEKEDEELFEAIVAEFDFPSAGRAMIPATEVHSHDFPSLAAFVARVESLDAFQAVMNREPLGSEIYAQEL